MDRWTDGQMDRWSDEQMVRWTDGQRERGRGKEGRMGSDLRQGVLVLADGIGFTLHSPRVNAPFGFT